MIETRVFDHKRLRFVRHGNSTLLLTASLIASTPTVRRLT